MDGLAEQLPASSASFDGAVACLMLCSVPSQQAALAEMHRVLRPGGQLRFYEHVQAGSAGMRRLQRMLDATLWPVFAAGVTPAVIPLPPSRAPGWTIAALDTFSYPEVPVRGPAATHILGTDIRGPVA